MGRLFGTDGIRGVAFTELSLELVEKVSRATAVEFSSENSTLLIGRDTRNSGPQIEEAICKGFMAEGWNVSSVGIIPTPGIAHLCKTRNSFGAVISASHNPAEYNGIKFFSNTGQKLTDEQEDAIESRVDGFDLSSSNNSCQYDESLQNEYLNEVTRLFNLDLTGKKIVIDCAFGATYKIAPKIFRSLGAEIIEYGTTADGDRINVNCGATYPELISKLTKENSNIIAGFSFDGDGDRCIACDGNGTIVDGDKIMGIISRSLQVQNRLPNNLLISTVMSNGGLEDYLKKYGISMKRSQVGDRYVWKMMNETGSNIGGEQSGHVILKDRATTGDGLISALSLLEAMEVLNSDLSTLAGEIPTYPQELINIQVKNKQAVLDSGIIEELTRWGTEQFNENGRVLIRPSGTEPKIRVMAESPSKENCSRIVKETANRIQREFGI